jgi:hypothetical protein
VTKHSTSVDLVTYRLLKTTQVEFSGYATGRGVGEAGEPSAAIGSPVDRRPDTVVILSPLTGSWPGIIVIT